MNCTSDVTQQPAFYLRTPKDPEEGGFGPLGNAEVDIQNDIF